MSLTATPSAASKTILERRARPAEIDDERSRDSSASRSTADTSTVTVNATPHDPVNRPMSEVIQLPRHYEPKPSLDEEPPDPMSHHITGVGARNVKARYTSEACARGDLLEFGPALLKMRFCNHGMHKTSSLYSRRPVCRHGGSWLRLARVLDADSERAHQRFPAPRIPRLSLP